MASIQKRGKTYQFKVSLGRDADGKQIRETKTYIPKSTTPKALEKELAAAARDFEREVREGRYLSGEKITFQEFTEKYWKPQWASVHLTQSVMEGYIDLIERWAYPVFKVIKIARIMPLHIQGIIDTMRNKGLAPKTIKRVYTAINSVFTFAYRMKIVQENPCTRCELPKIQQDTELHYFTVPQAKAFLAFLDQPYTSTYSAHTRTDDTDLDYSVPEYTETHIMQYQFRVFFNLAIYGGFRRGELVAMQWQDIDFENCAISVNRAAAKVSGGQIIKEPKTKKSARTLIMPAESMQLLREWKKRQQELSIKLGTIWKGKRGKRYDENFVFIQIDSGLMMYLDTPGRKFRQTIDRYNDRIDAKIKDASEAEAEKLQAEKLPRIRLHDLRHTSATILLADGVDIETVSHRMGHAHASTTLDIYGHPLPELDKSAAAAIEKIFSKA